MNYPKQNEVQAVTVIPEDDARERYTINPDGREASNQGGIQKV